MWGAEPAHFRILSEVDIQRAPRLNVPFWGQKVSRGNAPHVSTTPWPGLCRVRKHPS